jgi:hypothetical protein
MTKQKQFFGHFWTFMKNVKYHMNYSNPLLSTLLKHLWQRLPIGTPVSGEFLPFFSADPLQLCQAG